MEDKKLFLIGEVAKMFHISMGTLRHYEQAALLEPEYTDPDTGYRIPLLWSASVRTAQYHTISQGSGFSTFPDKSISGQS